MRTEFIIAGEDNQPIRCDVYRTLPRHELGATEPVLIFCHGFKGFKDWGGWPHFRRAISEAGIAAIGVNYSHNGIGDDPNSFTRLDLFKRDTLGIQTRDVMRVIDSVRQGLVPGLTANKERSIVLVGHSRGGVPVLKIAAADAALCAIVLLASIARLPAVSTEDQATWRRDQELITKNFRTGQDMPLGIALLEELLSEPEMVKHAAELVKIPALIIHGDKDSSVPVESASELSRWIGGAELILLKDCDHNFGTAHPYAGTTDNFERVIAEVIRFVVDSVGASNRQA
jgi:pimeloyl-ACP methyl ester carboxylesterase